jgi:hypothetical protein
MGSPRQALWGVLGSCVMVVSLQACTTTAWTNTTKSQTDLAADQAACYTQLLQETQGGALSLYVAEPVVEFRRCMQRKGWSPPYWQLFSS